MNIKLDGKEIIPIDKMSHDELYEEVQKLGFEKAKLDWLVRRVEMYNRLPWFLRIFYKVKFPPIFDEYLQIRPYKDEKM